MSAVDLAHAAVAARSTEEAADLDRIRLYATGRQRFPGVLDGALPSAVYALAASCRVNAVDVVVQSLVQSLHVDAVRVHAQVEDPDAGVQPGDTVEAAAWRLWQANGLDAAQAGLHRAAVTYGHAWGAALPGADPATPAIAVLSPRHVWPLYDDRGALVAALLAPPSAGAVVVTATEATPVAARSGGTLGTVWEQRGDPIPHAAGRVPVVRFEEIRDLDRDDEPPSQALRRPGDRPARHTAGSVAPLTSLQDQLDLASFALGVATHFSAFRQRYVIGWVASSEREAAQASASTLWQFPDSPEDIKVGDFPQTDLTGMITSRQHTFRHLATLSQTPVHELVGEMINLSAEALAAVEAGRDRRVGERQTSLGESWEQLLRVAGAMAQPVISVPDDAQVVWRDTTSRSFAATVDGLVKLAAGLGVPASELWQRIPGVTAQDIRGYHAAAATAADPIGDLTRLLDGQREPE